MNRSHFKEASIAFLLIGERNGAPIAEVRRKKALAKEIFYDWRTTHARLLPTEMMRLRQLDDDNARLKRVVAEITMDRAMLRDVLKENLKTWSQTR